MRLKGITAVWAKNHGTTTKPKDANHFTGGGMIILDVFDHFVTEDQVKGRGRKRNKLPRGVEDMWRVGVCFGGAFNVIFQSNNRSAKWSEVFHVHAYPTAIFKNPALDAFARGTEDHFETALLSCPPDIGWFTTQRSFVEVSLIHGANYILHLF